MELSVISVTRLSVFKTCTPMYAIYTYSLPMEAVCFGLASFAWFTTQVLWGVVGIKKEIKVACGVDEFLLAWLLHFNHTICDNKLIFSCIPVLFSLSLNPLRYL